MKRLITTTINGREREVAVAPNRTLLEMLRDELELRGAVEGCGVGVCGSCTVLIEDRPVSSCLTLATNVEGRSVTTIEGLAVGGELSPVQQAFLRFQAFQCGFCTPGMIMAVEGLLRANPSPDEAEIRDYLSGNLCRCGTYSAVIEAVQSLVAQDAEAGAARAGTEAAGGTQVGAARPIAHG
jgi:aerobic-type carbon monoxide dehydrogenase small subunit (CoxS/CutS family)